MLENLNLSLFSLINATPDSAPWMISLAIFIAKDLITVVPLLAAVLWLWGLTAQRQLVIKIAIALAVSLLVSGRWDIFFRTTDRLSKISAITSCIMRRMTHSRAITVR